MDFTGERFVPGGAGDGEIAIEHLQRYRSIQPLIAGCAVLDAASGAGYGADALALHAADVLGIDNSPEAVAHARATYRRPNLSFLEGSIAELPCADASLDRVVSFETIEHVDAATQARFLDEVDRVLRPDGLLIISTPDRRIYRERDGHVNAFHLAEFDEPEFRAFLARRFGHVALYRQRFEVASTLHDGRDAAMRVLNPAAPPPTGRYMVAVCGRRPFEAPAIASVVLDDGDRLHAMTQRILALQDDHERLQAHIRTLGAQLGALEARNGELARQNDALAHQNDALAAQLGAERQEAAAWRAQAEAAASSAAALAAEVAALRQSTTWRMTAPLRAVVSGWRRSGPRPE